MDAPDLGRYSYPAMLILASLAGGEKYGYAIMEDIKTTSGIKLRAGTLYGAISRLEGAGLIEALPADERQRPYRLTGQRVEAPVIGQVTLRATQVPLPQQSSAVASALQHFR